ncbi:MAG: pitrilysin family protein [Tepidisphaeraceae bacterium]|jgi:zinc protease
MRKSIKACVAAILVATLVYVIGCGSSGTKEVAGRDVAGPAVSSREDFSRELHRTVYGPDEAMVQLANGMVVIARRASTPVVTVRGYVNAGSLYEGKWLGGGLSHLLEHLVAGGSNGRRTEEQNRDLLQSIGNESNAYTTTYCTSFFVNTTTDNLDKAADLVTGWMLTAKIPPAEYAREYEVVQRELEKDEGEPEWMMDDLEARNRYRVSPARVPVIGYQEVIRGLSRDDVYAYYKLAYQPNNMVFVVVGDADPETLLAAVKKHVKDAPPGRGFSHAIEDEPPLLAPRTAVATFPKLGDAKIELGFPTFPLASTDLYATDLLAAVLGAGNSSILVEEIRDKGLVSEISAGHDTPHYVSGTFQIDMSVEAGKIAEASRAVLAVIERVKKEGVDADRLRRAKVQMRSAKAMSLQTAENIGETLAQDYLTSGDPHFTQTYLEAIDKVTVEQIGAVAAKYLDTSRLLTTALVPEEAVGKEGLAGAQKLLGMAIGAATTRPAESSRIVRYEMQDGTVVLLKRIPSSPVVSISLYALGGVTAEDAANNGIGNLTMQAAARGTGTRTAGDIAKLMDELGGGIKAECGNNSWDIRLTCMPADFPRGLDLLVDVFRNPKFPAEEVDPLRKRMAAAIESQDADWFAQSMRFARQTYFGPGNSPYQFMPVGRKESVEKLTAGQLAEWHAKKIAPAKRVLAIFGNVDMEQGKKLAEKYFGKSEQSRGGTPAVPGGAPGGVPDAKPTIHVREVKINPTDNPQAGVILMFDSGSFAGDRDLPALTVADTMCSGYRYPTGYLFDTLRGEGLVYDVNAYVFPGASDKTPGAFVVYAGCDPKNVNRVVDGILLNIARLQGSDKDLVPDWFERSKELIVTADALEKETAESQADTAAVDELLGLGCEYHEQFGESIKRVTLGEVRMVSRRLLSSCAIAITTSAPKEVGIGPGGRSYSAFPPVDLTPKGVEHDARGK